MNAHMLTLLLEGAYVCQYRYPDEFRMLEDADERAAVGDWLRPLKRRLARLGESGAFFVAPDFLGPKDVTQIRKELLAFRDDYGAAVLQLDFIRQSDAGSVFLSPGELIALFDLDRAVAQSTMLESQLRALHGVTRNASLRNSNYENLRRLLEHLERDGYVVVANKESGVYQVTGKIEQLYAVLQFLDENKVIPDAEVDDRTEDADDDLVDEAQAADRATGTEGGRP